MYLEGPDNRFPKCSHKSKRNLRPLRTAGDKRGMQLRTRWGLSSPSAKEAVEGTLPSPLQRDLEDQNAQTVD